MTFRIWKGLKTVNTGAKNYIFLHSYYYYYYYYYYFGNCTCAYICIRSVL